MLRKLTFGSRRTLTRYNGVARSILTSFPETPRRVLDGRYPSAFDGGLFAMRFPIRPGEVTVEHLDNYRSDYKEFATQVHAWARGFLCYWAAVGR